MDFHQEQAGKLIGDSIEDTKNAISTITNDLSSNSAAIVTNTTNIGLNTAAIGTNTTNIGLNTTAIGTNTTNIGLNTTAIGTNATNIGLNTTAIGNIINDSSTSLTSTWSSQEIDNQIIASQPQALEAARFQADDIFIAPTGGLRKFTTEHFNNAPSVFENINPNPDPKVLIHASGVYTFTFSGQQTGGTPTEKLFKARITKTPSGEQELFTGVNYLTDTDISVTAVFIIPPGQEGTLEIFQQHNAGANITLEELYMDIVRVGSL
jgi:hypothetical protein